MVLVYGKHLFDFDIRSKILIRYILLYFELQVVVSATRCYPFKGSILKLIKNILSKYLHNSAERSVCVCTSVVKSLTTHALALKNFTRPIG